MIEKCNRKTCLRAVTTNNQNEDYKEFLDQVLEILQKEISETDVHKDSSNSKHNYDFLSKKGKFLWKILDLYGRLKKLLDDLNRVEAFITSFPNMEIYEENKINEIAYLNYHLEVFYHKIHTIGEVQKIIVAQVFELDICDKDCNWDNLNARKNDIEPNVIDVIDRYYKSFKSMINVRHLNTHRSLNVNPSSNEISALLLLHENSKSYSESENFIFNKQIKGSIEKHINKKVEYIHDSKEIAKKYVDELLYEILIEALKRADNK